MSPPSCSGCHIQLDHGGALPRIVGHDYTLIRHLDTGGDDVQVDLNLDIIAIRVVIKSPVLGTRIISREGDSVDAERKSNSGIGACGDLSAVLLPGP